MLIDPVLIALLRRDAKGRLGPGLIPEIHPLAKGHIRFCFAGDDAAFHFHRIQLGKALLFGFRCDAFCHGLALAVVSDNDAPFPASVYSQAEGAVA